MRWTMARPRPLPRRTPPWNGWKMPSSSSGAMPTPSSCDRDHDSPLSGRRIGVDGAPTQAQPAAARHRAQAVGREVPDDLLDLPLVGLDTTTGSGGTSTSMRARSCTSALLRSSSAVSVSTRRTSTSTTAERCGRAYARKIADGRVQPLRLAEHDVHQLRLLGAQRQLVTQNLNRAGHRGQRIADLVGDAGGHLADGGEPLLHRAPRARAS